MIVYIAEQGSQLHKTGERLSVIKEGIVLRWFHTKDIQQIIIMGSISLTSPVITYLLKEKIDTVFMSYFGKYRGRLVGEFGKNIALRVSQYGYLSIPDKCKVLAKIYILGKIENQIYMMQRRNYRIKSNEVIKSLTILRHLSKQIKEGDDNLESLRGYEGSAARVYFSVFSHFLLIDDFIFNGRNRRPPKDEINALLSLAYTFLMNQIQTKLYECGLDPYYGALHQLSYGRQSLALDIMEEFRPLVDDFVLSMINKKIIRKNHFKYNSNLNDSADGEIEGNLPVMLTPDGMRKFIFQFQEFLKTNYFYFDKDGKYKLSYIFLLQCQSMARVLKDSELDYKSFNWKINVLN